MTAGRSRSTLALEEHDTYYALKGGFDPAFHSYSPGRLIVHATLERAFALGLRRYEFLGKGEEYKRPWATGPSDRTLFQAFAPTLPGYLSRMMFTSGRRIAKRVRLA